MKVLLTNPSMHRLQHMSRGMWHAPWHAPWCKMPTQFGSMSGIVSYRPALLLSKTFTQNQVQRPK